MSQITDEQILEAIDSIDVEFGMSLERLVDGVYTYRLHYSGGETLYFTDDDMSGATDKLYAHVAETKRQAKLTAVKALLLSALPVGAETGEPVAWVLAEHADNGQVLYSPPIWSADEAERYRKANPGALITPLYAAPPRSDKANALTVDDIEAIILAAEPDVPACVDGNTIWTRRMAVALAAALSTSPAVPNTVGEDKREDAIEEAVTAVARLYGNFIDGHGWTGFGPSPEKIRSAIVSLVSQEAGE